MLSLCVCRYKYIKSVHFTMFEYNGIIDYHSIRRRHSIPHSLIFFVVVCVCRSIDINYPILWTELISQQTIDFPTRKWSASLKLMVKMLVDRRWFCSSFWNSANHYRKHFIRRHRKKEKTRTLSGTRVESQFTNDTTTKKTEEKRSNARCSQPAHSHTHTLCVEHD